MEIDTGVYKQFALITIMNESFLFDIFGGLETKIKKMTLAHNFRHVGLSVFPSVCMSVGVSELLNR
jgi:hypothetical protein